MLVGTVVPAVVSQWVALDYRGGRHLLIVDERGVWYADPDVTFWWEAKWSVHPPNLSSAIRWKRPEVERWGDVVKVVLPWWVIVAGVGVPAVGVWFWTRPRRVVRGKGFPVEGKG
jgi:hypothetical protein